MKQNGFSLVELLVVVGIIGALLSVVVPTLEKARGRVQYMSCQVHQRQLGFCFEMYATDNGFKFPSSDRTWANDLMPYFGEMQEILLCPMAKLAGGGTAGTFTAYSFDPTPKAGDEIVGSYGMNAWICDLPNTPKEIYGVPVSNAWRQTDAVSASPASVPVLLDSMWMAAYPDNTNLPPAIDGDFNGCDLTGKGTRQMRHFCIDRHDGSVNGVFLDLSIRRVGLKELWTLKWHRGSDTSAPEPQWPDWMKGLDQ